MTWYKYPNSPIQGWMSLSEIQWLYRQAKQYKTIVEIGCWKGKSTHALLTGAQSHGGKVSVVDHFKGAAGQEQFFPEVAYLDIYHIFMASLGHFSNLSVYKMDSLSGSKRIKKAEMIFIDAGHEYEEIKQDLELWEPKATKLLCGHDYQFPGVKKAVVEKFGIPNVIDSIWYVTVEK